MQALRYTFNCGSCQFVVEYVKFAVGEDGNALFWFTCPMCHKDTLYKIDLEEIIRNIPAPKPAVVLQIAEGYTAEDRTMMAGMHIALEDDV